MTAKRITDRNGVTQVRYTVQAHAHEGNTEAARELLGYTYPIDLVPGDRRLSEALVRDLCRLLVTHGFPAPQPGRDVKRMRRVLLAMIYRQDVE